MNISTDVLYLDGVRVATPKEDGISLGRYKTWSENSGRTDEGKAIGTIKYIKTKLEISWDTLTSADIIKIDNIVSNKSKPFVSVKFRGLDGEFKTITTYFGDSVIPITRYKNGKPVISGYKLSTIEQ